MLFETQGLDVMTTATNPNCQLKMELVQSQGGSNAMPPSIRLGAFTLLGNL